MKKIFTILLMILMCIGVNAQVVRYSQELVDKAESGDAQAMSDLGECYEYGIGISKNDSLSEYWYKKAFTIFNTKVESGDIESMYNLGQCYRRGQGIPYDGSKADYWFKKWVNILKRKAEGGDVESMKRLGKYYISDIFVLDFSQSIYWYKKAAKFGNAQAMYNLGLLYNYGMELSNIPPDYSKAIYWYKKAADNGNADAMLSLGICYKCGDGVSQDYSQAVYWYKNAAEKGNAYAMYELATSYKKGKGVSQDDSKTFYWYNKGAELGHCLAMLGLAHCYRKGSGISMDYSKAFYWYKEAYDHGCGNADYWLGYCYEVGIGTSKDYSKAFYWYNEAAKGGLDDRAMYELGICYQYGKGVSQNYSQAVYWYKKAMEKGNADAMFNLSFIYRYDRTDTLEYSKAAYWAEKGNSIAMSNLGICYELGKGVTKNINKAVYWYKRAIEKRESSAMKLLDLCFLNGNGVSKDKEKAALLKKASEQQGNYRCYVENVYEYLLKSVPEVAKNYKNVSLNDLYDGHNRIIDLRDEWVGDFTETLNTSSDTYDNFIYDNNNITYSQELVNKAECGDVNAMYNLGYCYYNAYDLTLAMYWFYKASMKGYSKAMVGLADIISLCPNLNDFSSLFIKETVDHGSFDSPSINLYDFDNFYFASLFWYKLAAKKGNVQAMTILGELYQKSFYYNLDYSLSAYWYNMAAQQGSADAMANLGILYYYGRGVLQDYSQSVYWFRKGAEKGNSTSMNNLGKCYEKGHGVKKNKVKANNLYEARNLIEVGDIQGAVKQLHKFFPEFNLEDVSSFSFNNEDSSNSVSDKRTITPPIIQIVPGSIMFADATGNNAIDANEKCSVRFKVKNVGKGEGYDCVAKVKSSTNGISAGEKMIDRINAGETVDVEISVKSGMNTKDGTTDLSVWVDEPNGLGCDPIILSVNTNAFATPMLKIVDYATTSETGGKLRKMMPFNLQMILQNTQHGNAEDVNVRIDLPKDVLLVDGESSKSYAMINGGDKKNISVGLMAKNVYTASSIPVKVTISEKYGKYAESRTIDLAMSQQMSANRIVIDENESSSKGDIEIARIEGKIKLSDVDRNIPHTGRNNSNTFAVVIANENYINESKVDYAINDGTVFATYCKEVLGIPSENIHLRKDATFGVIRGDVSWLKQISESYDDAQLIFYYAGHGVPDEISKDAYLLPTDGMGTELSTAYKLDDLYSTLSQCKSKRTLVFLDACFSGKQRNGKDMSSARAAGISTRKTAPKGQMVVFSAAQGKESAYPYIDKQHGMFTYFLLKKLQDSKGDVTLGDLGSYIITNVKQKSVLTNIKRQTPTVQSSSSMMKSWKSMKL